MTSGGECNTAKVDTPANGHSFSRSFFRRLEGYLQDFGLIVFTAIACFGVLIISLWKLHKYDGIQVIEAVVVAFNGVVASYNFTVIGKKFVRAISEGAADGIDSKCLYHNCFMLLNIITFGMAVFLLTFRDRPFLSVLGIFSVFLSFAIGNLVQTRVLKEMLRSCPPASAPEQTGALLVKVSGWLASENGPSMIGYALFVFLAALFERRHSVEAFATFAVGAASFHLSVSVLGFSSGLMTTPLGKSVEHIAWGKSTCPNPSKTLAETVAEATDRFLRFWRIAMGVCMFCVAIGWVIANWPWLACNVFHLLTLTRDAWKILWLHAS